MQLVDSFFHFLGFLKILSDPLIAGSENVVRERERAGDGNFPQSAEANDRGRIKRREVDFVVGAGLTGFPSELGKDGGLVFISLTGGSVIEEEGDSTNPSMRMPSPVATSTTGAVNPMGARGFDLR